MVKRFALVFVVLALAAATAVAAPSLNGSRGLMRVLSADNDSKGAFAIGAHGTLWTMDSTDTHTGKETSIGIWPFLSYAPMDYVELSAMGGYGMYKWENHVVPLTQTTLDTITGDLSRLLNTQVGLKLSYSPTPIFTGGLYGFVTLPTMDDTFKILFSSPTASLVENKVGGGVLGLLTFDFGRLENPVPLRFHLNGGYQGNLNEYYVAPDTTTIGEDELILMGAGLEYNTKYVTPFVEFTYAWPQGDSTVDFLGRNQFSEGPMLTPGLRITFPFGLNVDAAVDINMTSEDTAQGVVKPWDWQAIGGLSYCYDFVPAVPPAPPTGTIAGRLTDAATGDPLEGEVSFPGTGVPSVYSDMSGAFTASGVPVGEVTVSVAKEGYIPQDMVAMVVKNKITAQDFALEKKPIPKGTIAGKVTDRATGMPIAATISFPGTDVPSVMTDAATGTYSVTVTAGSYTVNATADGYAPMSGMVSAAQNRTATQDFVLLSTVAKITLKGITFASGKSVIQPESYSVLDDAARMLNDYPNVRVEIAGYTDSRGSGSKNLKLSQGRADAVRTYLIDKGIAADRLVAKGYGEADPVASNKTSAGRAENRRIEFHVIP